MRPSGSVVSSGQSSSKELKRLQHELQAMREQVLDIYSVVLLLLFKEEIMNYCFGVRRLAVRFAWTVQEIWCLCADMQHVNGVATKSLFVQFVVALLRVVLSSTSFEESLLAVNCRSHYSSHFSFYLISPPLLPAFITNNTYFLFFFSKHIMCMCCVCAIFCSSS